MRKAFNSENTTVLEIKPMEEIVEETPEGIPDPQKINYKQSEVFDQKEAKEEPEEEVENEVELKIEEKRGIGKRGKDKKPRLKRENVSERQLAHLAKCREISKQKREAKKLEKERLKQEINKKVDENTNKNRIIQMDIKKDIKKESLQEPVNKGMEYDKFFSLMEKYDVYKQKKKELKKVQTKQQPLPSNVKDIHRPKKPINIIQEPVSKNPYDIYFNY